MKKLIMILVYILTNFTPSQAGNCQRMLVEGRRWVYEETWWEEGIGTPQYRRMEHYLTIEGDTLFQEQKCKRIVDVDDMGIRLIGMAYEEKEKVYCYMLTDTVFQQYLAPELNQWELLYDFRTGESQQTETVALWSWLTTDMKIFWKGLTFEKTDTLRVRERDFMRQVWGWPSYPDRDKEYIVESIGCGSGLLPIWSIIDNGNTTKFLACYDGDELVFTADDFNVSSSVDTPHSASSSPLLYYDLTGRRVTNPRQGIYVQDGRKVIRK